MEIQQPENKEKEISDKRTGILKKILYIFLGFLFVGLGIIGMPIPILPTIPFMMYAGFFFLRSSEKLNF